MGYCTTDEVYEATKLTTSVVPAASVTNFILAAEESVDKFTFTTYWNVEDSGTATDGDDATLTDSGQTWSTNGFAEMELWIYGGTGIGQIRTISSNTGTVKNAPFQPTCHPRNAASGSPRSSAKRCSIKSPTANNLSLVMIFSPRFSK